MKSLTVQLKRSFFLTLALSAILLAFMTLPGLAAAREAVASKISLSPSGLWIPTSVLLLAAQYLFFQRAIALAAKPFSTLAKNASQGDLGPAFRSKSLSKEEDSLKHSFESATLKLKEATERGEDLESELDQTTATSESLSKKYQALESRLHETDSVNRELQVRVETLQSSKLALEVTLDNERKSKVGVEVEKRANEIYAQLSNAVSSAAFKAVWVPSIINELKTPISVINQQAKQLQKSWDSVSIAKVKEEVSQICEQSEIQLRLLQDIIEREAPKLDTATVESSTEDVKETPTSSLSLKNRTPEPAKQPTETLDAPTINANEIAQEQSVESQETDLTISEDIAALEHHAIVEEDFETNIEPQSTSSSRGDAARSQYDLQIILQNLANEFSLAAPDANITYSVDEDLEIELTDSTLLLLLHTLVETAVERVIEGDITIGVDLHPDSIEFDVACDGRLHLDTDIDLSKAEPLAEDLGGEICIDAAGNSELHFSFSYRFNAVEEDSTIELS